MSSSNKENTRKCFKCGVSPVEDPNIAVFRFPKPGKNNSLRCELWAKFCFPNGEWFSREFQEKLHKEHKMLCSRHFEKTFFSDYPLTTKKLHRCAVPHIQTIDEQDAQPEHSHILQTLPDKFNVTPTTKVPQPLYTEEPQPGPSHILQDKTNLNCVTEQPSINMAPPPSHLSLVPLSTKPLPLLPSLDNTSSQGPPLSNLKNLKIQTKSKREKYLYAKCRKQIKNIYQLRRRINKLKNKAFLREISTNESVETLVNKLTPTFALLLQAQIKNLRKKSQGRRWTTEEKITALRLYKRSPTCYRLLRRLFCLPTPSTLKCLLSNFCLEVGINKPIFNVLNKYLESQKPSDKEFVLMFDEMSVKKSLFYNKKKDIIEGYQDHGMQGRCAQLASYALVFMIAGVRKKVKQPVAFYLSSGSVTADRLAVLIKEILLECLQAGLSIAATVCDMDGVNRRALTILGATVEKPYITIENIEVVTMFDPPHLLKCFRNLFMKYDVKCNTQINSNNRSGVGIAKWSHIKQFYEMDNSNPNFVFAPALKQDHLNPNSKQKMKVKLAAQVLSHTVAAGMMAKISEGELSTEAVVTVDVIELLDKLFDSLNSDSPNLRRGKIHATNIKPTTPHLNFFNNMKQFFISLQFIGSNRKPPSIEGWVWTLNAVERIWKNITKKHSDIKSLATRRLQQDPLENLFGCIRGNCGANYNPTTGQFIAGLKTAILSNLAHLGTGNCEKDTYETIINNYKLLLQKNPQTQSHVPVNQLQNLSDFTYMSDEFIRYYDIDSGNQSSGEIQACAYVCGFLIKNLNADDCLTCRKIFISTEISKEHLFVQCKEYNLLKNCLKYCNKNVITFVESCATVANTNLEVMSDKENICQNIINHLKETVNLDFLKACPKHGEKIGYYLLHSIVYVCVKRYCTIQNRRFAEESSRAALQRKMNIIRHN